MGLDESVQNIAGALKPSNQEPSARWRWGTVESVTEYGTMNVSIGGATVPGIRAAQHVMGAQVGDRVRVLYCGTECMVDAVRATSDLMSVPSPSMDADTKGAWLDALGFKGFESGTYSNASLTLGSSAWYGLYWTTVYIPITARADTGYLVQATLHCTGNLVWTSVSEKAVDGFTLFVMTPRGNGYKPDVKIYWEVYG